MSSNVVEMNKSLLDRQKEQIDILLATLEIAKRRIHHYEEVINNLRKERQDLYHAELRTIKLSSDFLNREANYIQTINTLTKQNHSLTKDKIKLEDSVKQNEEIKSMSRPLHLTPSYADIGKREIDILHIRERKLFDEYHGEVNSEPPKQL